MRFFIAAVTCLLLFLTGCQMQKNQDLPTERNQKAAEYNVQLGIAYLQQGNTKRAKRKLLIALKQAPKWSPAYDAMALFLERTGELQSAKQYYEKAISLNPNAGASYNNFGTFLCRQNEYRQAINQFLKAVKDPSYTSSANAYENAGLCALAIPNRQLAATYFKKAIENDPQRPTSLLEMARIRYGMKRYKIAENYYKAYTNIAQPTAESLLLGIQIARKMGDKKTAQFNAVTLKTLFPNSNEYKLYKDKLRT